MVEIARVITIGAKNRRDIVRRLMATSKAFCNMDFSTAIAHFRYFENNGLIENRNGHIVIYYNFED